MFLIRHCSESAIDRLDCAKPKIKGRASSNHNSKAVGNQFLFDQFDGPNYFLQDETVSDLSTDYQSSVFSSPKTFLYSSLHTDLSDSPYSNLMNSPESAENSVGVSRGERDGKHHPRRYTKSDQIRSTFVPIVEEDESCDSDSKSENKFEDKGCPAGIKGPRTLDRRIVLAMSRTESEATSLDEGFCMNSIQLFPSEKGNDPKTDGFESDSDSSRLLIVENDNMLDGTSQQHTTLSEKERNILSLTWQSKELINGYLRERESQLPAWLKDSWSGMRHVEHIPDTASPLSDESRKIAPSNLRAQHNHLRRSEKSKLISDFLRKRDVMKQKDSNITTHTDDDKHQTLQADNNIDKDKPHPKSPECSIDYSDVIDEYLKARRFVRAGYQPDGEEKSNFQTSWEGVSLKNVVSPQTPGHLEQSQRRYRRDNVRLPGFEMISPSSLASESVVHRRSLPDAYSIDDPESRAHTTRLHKEPLEQGIITTNSTVGNKNEAKHLHIDNERRCIRTSFPRALGRLACSSADHYYSSESTGSFLIAQ